jgi:3-hydroxyacyl-CoA dehydrogenase
VRIVNRPRDRAERARRFVEKQAPEVRARLGLSPDGAGGVEVATATDRRPRYGLVPFRVRCESVGFIFNRIWAAIKREALMVVHEGVATHEDVDRIWREAFGTAAAPFRMIDQVGLDVALDIEEHYAAIRDGVPEGPRRLLREYVHRGHLGVKAGRGFYADYDAPDS